MNIFELDEKGLRRAAKLIKEENRKLDKVMIKQPDVSFSKIAAISTLPLIELWRSRDYLCQIYNQNEEIEMRHLWVYKIGGINFGWHNGDMPQVLA